jgi:hypothetical protein
MELTLVLAQLLAVLAFVALLLAIIVFIRRAARFLADTRDLERFRKAVGEISGRAIGSLDEVIGPIDGLRRHTIAADAVVDDLARASASIATCADQARSLRGPAGAGSIRDDLAGELERAGRALEMVEHGCRILVSVRNDVRAPEAQTSVKRGYLNIVHAREAIVRHATRARELVVGEPWRLFQPPSA